MASVHRVKHGLFETAASLFLSIVVTGLAGAIPQTGAMGLSQCCVIRFIDVAQSSIFDELHR